MSKYCALLVRERLEGMISEMTDKGGGECLKISLGGGL